MWYIFEKRIVQGYQKLYSHMPNAQIQKYKYKYRCKYNYRNPNQIVMSMLSQWKKWAGRQHRLSTASQLERSVCKPTIDLCCSNNNLREGAPKETLGLQMQRKQRVLYVEEISQGAQTDPQPMSGYQQHLTSSPSSRDSRFSPKDYYYAQGAGRLPCKWKNLQRILAPALHWLLARRLKTTSFNPTNPLKLTCCQDASHQQQLLLLVKKRGRFQTQSCRSQRSWWD